MCRLKPAPKVFQGRYKTRIRDISRNIGNRNKSLHIGFLAINILALERGSLLMERGSGRSGGFIGFKRAWKGFQVFECGNYRAGTPAPRTENSQTKNPCTKNQELQHQEPPKTFILDESTPAAYIVLNN
ncbi:MAG: hypothetical protein M0P93_00005 [Candidatus Cloacimonetes bacterium]|jgi:hypothetical protein|nr:hypothetical protein [Candidatus Cloacimonadota bacterium]